MAVKVTEEVGVGDGVEPVPDGVGVGCEAVGVGVASVDDGVGTGVAVGLVDDGIGVAVAVLPGKQPLLIQSCSVKKLPYPSPTYTHSPIK